MNNEKAMARQERMEDLLTALLNCGYADLDVLINANYDMHDIVEYAREFTDSLTVNDLIYAMLNMGVNDMCNYINNERQKIIDNMTDEEYEEFSQIEFSPYEDIEIYVNSLDSHAWIVNGMQEHYEKYFPQAIAKFEEMTGISLI